MKYEHKEDAVSPVVGVMLMLVVTIIIAAVVAVFASGIATDSSSTPIAQFGVIGMTTVPGWDGSPYLETVTLINKGGDIIQAAEIDVVLTCDGSSNYFSLLGNKDGNNLYNMTVSNSAISAGNTITLTRYDTSTNNLKSFGFATGKSVEFRIIDTSSGNSIAGGKFIVS